MPSFVLLAMHLAADFIHSCSCVTPTPTLTHHSSASFRRLTLGVNLIHLPLNMFFYLHSECSYRTKYCLPENIFCKLGFRTFPFQILSLAYCSRPRLSTDNRLKMAFYVSPGPLCDWCKHCTIPQRAVYHSEHFKAISISPVTGIIFKAYEYSATQLADAFE